MENTLVNNKNKLNSMLEILTGKESHVRNDLRLLWQGERKWLL